MQSSTQSVRRYGNVLRYLDARDETLVAVGIAMQADYWTTAEITPYVANYLRAHIFDEELLQPFLASLELNNKHDSARVTARKRKLIEFGLLTPRPASDRAILERTLMNLATRPNWQQDAWSGRESFSNDEQGYRYLQSQMG